MLGVQAAIPRQWRIKLVEYDAEFRARYFLVSSVRKDRFRAMKMCFADSPRKLRPMA
jgi:hypothetical protein